LFEIDAINGHGSSGVIHRLWVVKDHNVIGKVKAGLRGQGRCSLPTDIIATKPH